MKKKISLLLLLLGILVQAAIAQNATSLVILHTNDMHSAINGWPQSHLYTPTIADNDPTRGGFARIGAFIKKEKELHESVLVVDAGDFFMGTLFTPAEMEKGFQLPLMNEMGYDVCALGNHEFDFGTKGLLNIVRNSRKDSQIPDLLLSNLKPNVKYNPYLDSLFTSNYIKPYSVVEKNGIRIGIFSLLGEHAYEVAPNLHKVKRVNNVKSARYYVSFLKEEKKCDIVLCLSHSGLNLNNGKFEGEDVVLASKVSGIDIIVSGHTHHTLVRPIMVNGTFIVQTGEKGENVGRIELVKSGNDWQVKRAGLVRMDDSLLGLMDLQKKVEVRQKEVEYFFTKDEEITFDTYLATTEFSLMRGGREPEKSNLGPLVADAMYYFNRLNNVESDVTVIANGMIRDNLVEGPQTLPDIFSVLSLGSGYDGIPGYPMAKIYLNGRDLKKMIEVLWMAQKKSAINYIYGQGIQVTIDDSKGFMRKVQKVQIGNSEQGYKTIDTNRKNKELYSVVADNYMLSFLPTLRRQTYGIIGVSVRDSLGNKLKSINNCIIDYNDEKKGIQEGKHWFALMTYLRSFEQNEQGLPVVPSKYNLPSSSIKLIQKD